MNVLSSGLPFAVGHDILRRFQSARGHEIRTLEWEGQLDPRLRMADYTYRLDEPAARIIDRIAKEWRPDIYLVWQPEMFPPPLDIEHSPIPTAALVSDWNIHFPQLQHNLQRYDVVLCDSLGSRVLRFEHVTPRYVTPLYSHDSARHRVRRTAKDIDVLFVGNMNHAIHHERAQRLRQLARVAGECSVLLTSGVFGEEYVTLLNRAHMVFNHSARGEMNMRVFEALACGALLFLEEENEETKTLLEPGKHYVAYGKDDLCDKVRYYAAHREEARAIAEAGQAAAANLSGEERLDELLDALKFAETIPRPFHHLPEEVRLAAGLTQYMLSQVDPQRLWAWQRAQELAAAGSGSTYLHNAAALTGLEYIRGMGSDDSGATRQILVLLQGACRRNPEEAVSWMNLGYVCDKSGALETAVHCYEQAIAASQAGPVPLLMGDYADPAHARWLRDCATGGESHQALRSMAHRHAADLQHRQGRYKEACHHAGEALRMDSRFHTCHALLGQSLWALGRRDEAVDALREGLPKAGIDHAYRDMLASCLKENGEVEQATALWQENQRFYRMFEISE